MNKKYIVPESMITDIMDDFEKFSKYILAYDAFAIVIKIVAYFLGFSGIMKTIADFLFDCIVYFWMAYGVAFFYKEKIRKKMNDNAIKRINHLIDKLHGIQMNYEKNDSIFQWIVNALTELKTDLSTGTNKYKYLVLFNHKFVTMLKAYETLLNYYMSKDDFMQRSEIIYATKKIRGCIVDLHEVLKDRRHDKCVFMDRLEYYDSIFRNDKFVEDFIEENMMTRYTYKYPAHDNIETQGDLVYWMSNYYTNGGFNKELKLLAKKLNENDHITLTKEGVDMIRKFDSMYSYVQYQHHGLGYFFNKHEIRYIKKQIKKYLKIMTKITESDQPRIKKEKQDIMSYFNSLIPNH